MKTRGVSTGRTTVWLWAVGIATVVGASGGADPPVPKLQSRVRALASTGTALSADAYPLILDRVSEVRREFFVFRDGDSPFGHGYGSGHFGAVAKIHLDAFCLDDPASPTGGTTSPNRLDRERGNVLRIRFDPLSSGQFAGVNFEEPENWGVTQSGKGYDLRGCTRVLFDVRSPTPGGIKVRFGVGTRNTSGFIHIPQSSTYTTMSLTLADMVPSAPDLADVHLLFRVAVDFANTAGGGTIMLDNIRFDPAPTRQASVLGFPVAYPHYGVVPVPAAGGGRAPYPLDQMFRNAAPGSMSAMTLQALLGRANPEDLAAARLVADTFHYALHHDTNGAVLPSQADARAFHDAYSAGEIALHNSQGTGRGQEGDARLAGFTCSGNEEPYCLLLDGTTGATNGQVMLALLAAYDAFGNTEYLEDARIVGRWLKVFLADETGTGFGGYYLGFSDLPHPRELIRGKSTEQNAILFAAFSALAAVEQELENTAAAESWTTAANAAGDFVVAMFDGASGRFHSGTVLEGVPHAPGIKPDGPQRGDDVTNTFEDLGPNVYAPLALSAHARYRSQLDWRRPLQYALAGFVRTFQVEARQFRGFNRVREITQGPDGIDWELTATAVSAMQFVDAVFDGSTFAAPIATYLAELRAAQLHAPFADGKGLVRVTLVGGEQASPYDDCMTLPFENVPARVGLSSTAWALFADQQRNPLYPAGDPPDATGAPTQLIASVRSATRVDLSWADNSEDETGFILERRQGSGAFLPVGGTPTVGPNVTQYLDTGLTPGVAYSYRVRATGPGGPSLDSNTADVTIPAGGKLVVNRRVMNFGTVRLGRQKTLSVQIRNTGRGELIGRVENLAAPFRVVSGAGSFRLLRNKSFLVKVEYKPTAAQKSTATLAIASTDPRRESALVSITGRGR